MCQAEWRAIGKKATQYYKLRRSTLSADNSKCTWDVVYALISKTCVSARTKALNDTSKAPYSGRQAPHMPVAMAFSAQAEHQLAFAAFTQKQYEQLSPEEYEVAMMAADTAITRQPRWKNSRRISTVVGRCQVGQACSSKGNEMLCRPSWHSTSKELKKRNPGKPTKRRSQTKPGLVKEYHHTSVWAAANMRTTSPRVTLEISQLPPNATKAIADTPGMMARQ